MCAAALTLLLSLAQAARALAQAPASEPGGRDEAGETSVREIPQTKEHAFAWNLALTGELVANAVGGIQSGAVADGLVFAGVTFDTRPLGLWAGGRLRVEGLALASGEPSSAFIGDLQVVSNVAAPSEIRFSRFYYRQRISSLTLRGGIMDLNDYFSVIDAADSLLNTSFGVPPTVEVNVPTATYPYPGFGAMAAEKWGAVTARAGVFQGDPTDVDTLFDGGYMLIAEAHVTWGDSERAHGDVTAGGWYRHGAPGAGPTETGGYYAIAEQSFPRPGGGRAALFAELAASPAHATEISYYAGFGADISRPLPHRSHDHLAVGVAAALLRRTASPEVSLEATYRMRLMKHLFLQPDVQVVNVPAGVHRTALVGILRLDLSLD